MAALSLIEPALTNTNQQELDLPFPEPVTASKVPSIAT